MCRVPGSILRAVKEFYGTGCETGFQAVFDPFGHQQFSYRLEGYGTFGCRTACRVFVCFFECRTVVHFFWFEFGSQVTCAAGGGTAVADGLCWETGRFG